MRSASPIPGADLGSYGGAQRRLYNTRGTLLRGYFALRSEKNVMKTIKVRVGRVAAARTVEWPNTRVRGGGRTGTATKRKRFTGEIERRQCGGENESFALRSETTAVTAFRKRAAKFFSATRHESRGLPTFLQKQMIRTPY